MNHRTKTKDDIVLYKNFLCLLLLSVALVACDHSTEVEDLEIQGSLRLISITSAGSVPYGVYVDGVYAYLTNNDGLLVFDVHDPEDPRQIGNVGLGVTFGVTVRREHAFTVGEEGLSIIDIKDPLHPEKLGDLQGQGEGHSICVEDGLAYIASSAGLEIVNISDPANPLQVSHFSSGGDARGIVLVDSVVYLANRVNGLEMIDVTNPPDPRKIATVRGTGVAWNVHQYQDYLFLGRHRYGVDIFRIEEKRNPQRIGIFCDDDEGETLSVWGDNAYLHVADNFSIELLDITNPAVPLEIGQVEGLNGAHDIFVQGDYIFIAEAMKGLIILEYTSE